MWVPPTSVGFRLPTPVALSHFVNLRALTLQVLPCKLLRVRHYADVQSMSSLLACESIRSRSSWCYNVARAQTLTPSRSEGVGTAANGCFRFRATPSGAQIRSPGRCLNCRGLRPLQGVSARRMPAALELPPSLVALTLDQGPQRWDQGSPPALQLQDLTRLTTLTLRNFR